jgi:hypothetical protein
VGARGTEVLRSGDRKTAFGSKESPSHPSAPKAGALGTPVFGALFAARVNS